MLKSFYLLSVVFTVLLSSNLRLISAQETQDVATEAAVQPGLLTASQDADQGAADDSKGSIIPEMEMVLSSLPASSDNEVNDGDAFQTADADKEMVGDALSNTGNVEESVVKETTVGDSGNEEITVVKEEEKAKKEESIQSGATNKESGVFQNLENPEIEAVADISNSHTESPDNEEKPAKPSSNIFVDFVAPMIKYRIMTKGNNTETEARDILNNITARMNVSESVSSDGSSENPFASATFFKEYITPIIRQGMITTGNKTEEEADALLDVISNAVETKAKIKAAFKEKFSSLTSSNATDPSTISNADFFKKYISPIIRIGIVTSGTKNDTEAEYIVDKITTAIVNRNATKKAKSDQVVDNPPETHSDEAVPEKSDTEVSISPFKTSTFFNDYIKPIIKHGMMTSGNKSEIEADAILDIISTSIKNRQDAKSMNVSGPITPAGGATFDPATFFQNFISPFIRTKMINAQNKTAVEADAILNIISTSMAIRNDPNTTSISALSTGSGSFFTNYITPIIRFGMINSGNKTESEADEIIKTIMSSIAMRAGPKPFVPSFGYGVNGTADFFENYISPFIRNRMITTGNKTESEADAILDIISTSMKTKKASNSIIESGKEEQTLADADDTTTAKKNISFFEKFVVPIIRYSIITHGNKTTEEANAILNLISPKDSNTTTTANAIPKSGNFFEDFIAPIIRNKIMGKGMKNESEADAIINSIIISEREKEATKAADQIDISEVDESDSSVENVTQKFIDGILLPDITKAINEIPNDAATSGTEVDIDVSAIAEASKKAIVDINDILVEVIDGENSAAESTSDEGSEDSTSSKKSKDSSASETTENSNKSKSSSDSGSILSNESESKVSEESKSSGPSEESESTSTEKSEESEESKSSESSNASKDSNLSEDSEDSTSSDKSTQSDSGTSTDTSKISEEKPSAYNAAETFVETYVDPLVKEKIETLKTMATFFTNPTVIEELQKSLKATLTSMNSESGSLTQAHGSETDVGKMSPKETSSLPADTSSNPLRWFVDQLVIPQLQKKSIALNNVAQGAASLQQNKSLSDTIYKIISKRLDGSSNYPGFATLQERSDPSANAKQFVTEVFIPKLEAAIKRFQNITASISTSDGETVISNEVKDFIDRILKVKSKLSTAKAEMRSNAIQKASGKLSKGQISQGMTELIQSESSSDSSLGKLVGDSIASAIKTSGEKLKELADKLSNPLVSKNIAQILKAKITSAIYSQRKEEDTKNGNPEDIVKQIVELKYRISEDRRKCDDLDKQIVITNVYNENMKLVLQKLELLQDIKNCSNTLRSLFIRLRGVQIPKGQNFPPSQFIDSSTAIQDPLVEIQNDVLQITKTKDDVIVYRRTINEMNRKLNQHSYIPNRMELVQSNLKMIWALKYASVKLNNLYEKLRQDQLALQYQEKNEKAQLKESPTNFEMEFTDAEKTKYAGLLQELNFAQKSFSSSDGDDEDASFINGIVFTGLGLIAIAVGTVGALLFRRRCQRHKLYTHIPSEQMVNSKTFLISKDSYGSCK